MAIEKIEVFKEAYKIVEEVDFQTTLELINKILFDGAGKIGNSEADKHLDEQKRQVGFRLRCGNESIITIISSQLNVTPNKPDSTVQIFGGNELNLHSGYEIDPNRFPKIKNEKEFEQREEQIKLLILTGVLKALTFSSSPFGRTQDK